MAKSIVSLAIGMALAEKKIASLDDTVAKYVPELAGNPYGETTIRNMLRMASGVPFNEVYDGKDDLAKFNRIRVDAGLDRGAARIHDARSGAGHALPLRLQPDRGADAAAARGDRHHAERISDAAALAADGRGSRRDLDQNQDGTETGSGNFNAILRDYGRLGILLANDGAAGGKQIVPKDYLLDATDWHRQPEAFTPRKATPYFGYGYQFWLFPGEKRRFALLGVYGQSIFVDPELKLVMVITGAAKNASVGKEPFARERDALWRGIVGKYGSW